MSASKYRATDARDINRGFICELKSETQIFQKFRSHLEFLSARIIVVITANWRVGFVYFRAEGRWIKVGKWVLRNFFIQGC